jgi:hypothetical protein
VRDSQQQLMAVARLQSLALPGQLPTVRMLHQPAWLRQQSEER